MEAVPRVHGIFKVNYGAKIGHIVDGTSNTMAIAEMVAGGECSIRATHSYDEGPVVMTDFTPNDPTPDMVRWCDPADGQPNSRYPCDWTSGTQGSLAGQFNMIRHTARSTHAGGVMVGMCDGSSHFVSDSIALEIWRALGTPDAGDVVEGF